MSIFKSFRYAFEGIAILLTERNFRIHLVMAILVISAGLWLSISMMEWVVIVICISMVLMAEGFNTAIELLCDSMTTDHDPMIKKIKDVCAGAVLILAAGAAIVGSLIFFPKI